MGGWALVPLCGVAEIISIFRLACFMLICCNCSRPNTLVALSPCSPKLNATFISSSLWPCALRPSVKIQKILTIPRLQNISLYFIDVVFGDSEQWCVNKKVI